MKIHARITREIEITDEEALALKQYCQKKNTGEFNDIDCRSEGIDDVIKGILVRFTDGIDSGHYEQGYIPSDWLVNDLFGDDYPYDYPSDIDL